MLYNIDASSPQPEGEWVANVFYPNTVIHDMENKKVTVEEVTYAMDHGTCHVSERGLLFVDELSKLGVVTDKSKTKIINIIANQNDMWVENFLARHDAANKKKRLVLPLNK